MIYHGSLNSGCRWRKWPLIVLRRSTTGCLSLIGTIKSRSSIMNRILLITLALLPLVYYSCATAENSPTAVASQISVDRPAYTYDEVLAIAQEFSPECRIQRRVPGQAPWCHGPTYLRYEEAEALFSGIYLGDGIWEVEKECPINSVFSRNWYFYEETAELVIRAD